MIHCTLRLILQDSSRCNAPSVPALREQQTVEESYGNAEGDEMTGGGVHRVVTLLRNASVLGSERLYGVGGLR